MNPLSIAMFAVGATSIVTTVTISNTTKYVQKKYKKYQELKKFDEMMEAGVEPDLSWVKKFNNIK